MKSYPLITYFILVILVMKSEAAKKWLPQVTGYSRYDDNNGYAGVFGKSITGLRVSGGKGYRVHIKGGKWLPAVTGNNANDGNNGYAGTLNGDAIDAVAISGGIQYAVHVQGGQWLPAVSGYNINDDNNGYAGILGKSIDAIMIKGRTYATSYNDASGSDPYVPYVPVSNPTSKEEKVKVIYNYIMKNVRGATKQGIAAVLGNWEVESDIEPKRAEGDYYDPPIGTANNRNSASYDNDSWLNMSGPEIYNGRYSTILRRGLGLGQWTDTPNSPRNTSLRNYAKSKGMKWYDLTLQLDFLLHGDNSYAITQVTNVLTSYDSVSNLARQFLNKWEGGQDDKLSQRQSNANKWYNYLVQNF